MDGSRNFLSPRNATRGRFPRRPLVVFGRGIAATARAFLCQTEAQTEGGHLYAPGTNAVSPHLREGVFGRPRALVRAKETRRFALVSIDTTKGGAVLRRLSMAALVAALALAAAGLAVAHDRNERARTQAAAATFTTSRTAVRSEEHTSELQ